MRKLICRFAADDSGATAIEYGLIAAGIGVAVITLVGQVGDEIRTMFSNLRDELVTFNGGAGGTGAAQ
ncbi:MAG: Flp family type IVb pilin [Chitinophagales bacterium]|nr:Flp family type IVb pilin [Hyphomicrobiales bacterium]